MTVRRDPGAPQAGASCYPDRVRRLHVLLAVGAAACSFDPDFEGSSSSGGLTTLGTGATDSATSTAASGSATSTTGAPTTGTSTTGPTSSSTSTSTSTSTSSSSTTTFGTTGGGAACGDGPGLLLWVEDAFDVEAPMELFDSTVLPACGDYDPIVYASSEVKDQGTVTWAIQTDQPVEVEIFGLVFDEVPGIDDLDPDSYYVSIDNAPELTWVYGCDTASWSDPQWGWIPVRPVIGQSCPAGLVTYGLDPGVHTIRLRNREGKTLGHTAAVAALFVAVTPAPDPYTVYDPYP